MFRVIVWSSHLDRTKPRELDGESVMKAYEELNWDRNLDRAVGTLLMLGFALSMALVGCEKRERVLEIDTPGADVTIEKKTDLTGDQKIEIKKTDSELRE